MSNRDKDGRTPTAQARTSPATFIRQVIAELRKVVWPTRPMVAQYFVVVLVFMQKYAPKSGIGTLTALMLPYSVCFWIVWTVVLILWMLTGLDLGPGGPLLYEKPV